MNIETLLAFFLGAAAVLVSGLAAELWGMLASKRKKRKASRGTDPREKYQEQTEGEGQTEPFTIEHDDPELRLRVERTERESRELHDGSDQLPAYDEIVERHVIPWCKRNPRVFDALRLMDDPAESAYMLALICEYPNAADLLEAGGALQLSADSGDLVDRLNSVSEVAGKYTKFMKDFSQAAKAAAGRSGGPKTCPAAT